MQSYLLKTQIHCLKQIKFLAAKDECLFMGWKAKKLKDNFIISFDKVIEEQTKIISVHNRNAF